MINNPLYRKSRPSSDEERSHARMRGFGFSLLITVATKCVANRFFHDLGHRRRTTQIALALLVHAGRQVAGSRLAMFCLAFGSQSKSLLGPFVCLLLWHLPSL